MGKKGKDKLTPERQEKILQYIRAGNYKKDAAQAAGVSHRTINRWIEKGKKEKTGKHAQFVQAIEKAEGEAIAHAVAVIRKKMITTWQAAAWWLERKCPQEWARREYIDSSMKVKDEDKELAEKAKKNPAVLEALLELQQRLDEADT